ncbi:ATP-binding protein [Verrucomicrobiales bacterium]|nr:ATP-binding protein [Verrucomicrobiales bacterium]
MLTNFNQLSFSGLAALLLSALIVTTAAEVPETPLGSVLELQNIEFGSHPVDLEITVTYHDPKWGVFFASDNGGSVFIKPAETVDPVVVAGTLIRVTGEVRADSPGVIHDAECFVIEKEHSGMRPQSVTLGQFDEDVLSSRFIAFDATIEGLMFGDGWVYLNLADGKHLMNAYVLEIPIENPIRNLLAGSRIRISGALGQIKEDGDVQSILYVQNAEQIEILSAAPTPEATTIVDTKEKLAGLSPGDKVWVSGLAMDVEEDTHFFVQVEDVGIRVASGASRMIHNGEFVEVHGTVADRTSGVAVSASEVKSIRFSVLKKPPIKKIGDLSPADQYTRVRLRGTVVSNVAGGDVHTCEIDDGSGRHTARIILSETALQNLNLERASEIEIAGVLTYSAEGNATLITTSLGDVTIQSSRSDLAWKSEEIMAIAGGLGFAAAILAVWILMLRNRVAAKTRALSDVTARLRASYEASREAIAIVGADGTVKECNSKFKCFFGEKLVAGDTFDRLLNYLARRVRDKENFISERLRLVESDAEGTFEMCLPDPEERFFEVHTAPVVECGEQGCGRRWTFHDVTEKTHLEKGLVQAQKMEAVGRLAGGIAHDFNNLLTGISGNLAVARLNGDKPLIESESYLDAAESATRRAAEMIKQLLGFSRKSTLETEVGNVNHVILRLMKLLKHSFNPNIEFEADLADDIWGTKIDSIHIEQVFLNLCVNARDSLENSAGSIQITSANVTRGGEEFVSISVKDTGKGMPDSVRSRIFEPFFTTKEQGKGTGLGLAMSFGIVEQHEGLMECKSEEGVGTEVIVYLPKVDGSVPQEMREEFAPIRGMQAQGKRILIVDDERVVRAVGEGLLRHRGFEVVSAENGAEALGILEDGIPIDLVILDLTMPVMCGRETIKKIRSDFPGVPVIICSGYLVDLDAFAEEVGSRPDAFIAKPFEPDTMINAVSACISEVALAS